MGVANAIVAQSVERWLPKPKVAESCSVYRSMDVNDVVAERYCRELEAV